MKTRLHHWRPLKAHAAKQNTEHFLSLCILLWILFRSVLFLGEVLRCSDLYLVDLYMINCMYGQPCRFSYLRLFVSACLFVNH